MATADYTVVRAETSASIRGLTPEAEDYAKQKGVSDDARKAVDRLTAYQVEKAALDAFMKQGKLGEYSEGD